MGWGVGEELTKSWPTFDQLCVQILLRRFHTVFLPPRARTKSGRPEVDQELDMGWQLLHEHFRVEIAGVFFYSSPLATPKKEGILNVHRNMPGSDYSAFCPLLLLVAEPGPFLHPPPFVPPLPLCIFWIEECQGSISRSLTCEQRHF